jgi:hypothetical protein
MSESRTSREWITPRAYLQNDTFPPGLRSRPTAAAEAEAKVSLLRPNRSRRLASNSVPAQPAREAGEGGGRRERPQAQGGGRRGPGPRGRGHGRRAPAGPRAARRGGGGELGP